MLTISARDPPRSTSVSPSDPELAARLRLAIVRMARLLRQEAGAGEELSPTLVAALATVELLGPLTPSALAAHERIKRPTAARVVARLEEAQLVTRTTDPSDRRVAHVAITPAGRALLKRIRRRKNEYLARRLRSLSEDEQATLAAAADLLERILADEPAMRARRERAS